MTLTVSVHCVDHKYAVEAAAKLEAMGFEDTTFVTNSALDMAIRGLIDLPTYVATAGDNLQPDLYLYLDVEVKPTVKRLKARGLKPIPNVVQLARLRYREWADVGALNKQTFSLCPDKEVLTEHELKSILGIVLDEKRQLLYDYSGEDNESTRDI